MFSWENCNISALKTKQRLSSFDQRALYFWKAPEPSRALLTNQNAKSENPGYAESFGKLTRLAGRTFAAHCTLTRRSCVLPIDHHHLSVQIWP